MTLKFNEPRESEPPEDQGKGPAHAVLSALIALVVGAIVGVGTTFASVYLLVFVADIMLSEEAMGMLEFMAIPVGLVVAFLVYKLLRRKKKTR